METLNYQPPLRGGVLKLCAIDCAKFSAEQLAAESRVAIDRAKAYLSILIHGDIIRPCCDLYTQGPEWHHWQNRATKSRPPKSAHRCMSEMDQLRRVLSRNVVKARINKDWTAYRLSQESGVSLTAIGRLENRCTPPTVAAVAMLAKALGVTVDHLLVP